MRAWLILPLAVLSMAAAEPAPRPEQPLPDAAQEARAQALFEHIRCVVCQHEFIADSPAGVAADMRRLVREEIAAGATDADIRNDLVRRFGDFVLFKPPFRPGTLLLWLGPLLAFLAATAVLLSRRRKDADAIALTPQEEARLHCLTAAETIRPDTDANSPDDGRAME